MRLDKKLRDLAFLTIILSLAIGCSRNRNIDPVFINPQFQNLTKEAVFEKGQEWMEARKFGPAREHFAHVWENYPNDPLGRRSLLRIADSYFEQGGPINLIEAEYKYRDFLTRYPGSEMADYATLRIALVSSEQMERPDRDQAKTHDAVRKLKEMIALYPNSTYREEAEGHLYRAQDNLAAHEHIVARFYMNRSRWTASLNRLNGLIDDYPQYEKRDEAFFDLAMTLEKLGRTGEARLYYERVMTEFPESDLARRAERQIGEVEGSEPEA